MKHAFHIPVLGLAFSIDTPLKVAKFGISSVLSIVDDELIERTRLFYAEKNNLPCVAISKKEDDYRAKRIAAYLDLVHDLVAADIEQLKKQDFKPSSDLTKYFELLPDDTEEKKLYINMLRLTEELERKNIQKTLRNKISAGAIDVNIMSKVDKTNFDLVGNKLDEKYNDALSAIRGFASSKLHSSVVLSAGMNPRLYNYIAELPAFAPDVQGRLQKQLILKVSEYRSAHIQAKYLAKKGVWISEFRVESGLNCGGHAFATDGYLLGPILEEFKQKKEELFAELKAVYRAALEQKGLPEVHELHLKFTVQGGIGTASEQLFLLNYYGFDSAGWGSPFLLVPEATTVDEQTLNDLINAKEEDFYLSNASPLGIPFNNFRKSTAETERRERIAKGKPGSPCIKKYLVSNTEFTQEPICTASREYQRSKIAELESLNLAADAHSDAYDRITEKTCLCDGLATAAYIKYGIINPRERKAVAICPGPNTAFFKNKYTLQQMVDHIYGRKQITLLNRPHIFINELQLYVDYLHTYMSDMAEDVKKIKFADKFRMQLLDGIDYYRSLHKRLTVFGFSDIQNFLGRLAAFEQQLNQKTL